MTIFERISALTTAIGGHIATLYHKLGTGTLTTSSQNVTGAINELNSGKMGKTDVLDASRLTGDIDPARLPSLSFFRSLKSTVATLELLPASEQTQITNDGKRNTYNAVTLTDGSTYIYFGGTKNDPVSYTLLSDTTPEWPRIANKPDLVLRQELGEDTDFVAILNTAMS